jgi:hypothetical protein
MRRNAVELYKQRLRDLKTVMTNAEMKQGLQMSRSTQSLSSMDASQLEHMLDLTYSIYVYYLLLNDVQGGLHFLHGEIEYSNLFDVENAPQMYPVLLRFQNSLRDLMGEARQCVTNSSFLSLLQKRSEASIREVGAKIVILFADPMGNKDSNSAILFRTELLSGLQRLIRSRAFPS